MPRTNSPAIDGAFSAVLVVARRYCCGRTASRRRLHSPLDRSISRSLIGRSLGMVTCSQSSLVHPNEPPSLSYIDEAVILLTALYALRGLSLLRYRHFSTSHLHYGIQSRSTKRVPRHNCVTRAYRTQLTRWSPGICPSIAGATETCRDRRAR